MKFLCYILLFTTLQFCNYTSQAQDSINNFKCNPFKYHIDESPFSIGGGIVAGGSSRLVALGMTFDFDYYHILFSLRLLHHPFMYDKYQTMSDVSAMIGYQYRNNKILGSLAAGIGHQNYACASGISGNCYGNELEKYKAIAFKAEVDYAFSTKVATGLMLQYSSNSRENVTAILACIKFGFFRSKK